MEALISLLFMAGIVFLIAKVANRLARREQFIKVLKDRYSAMEIRKSMGSRLGIARPKIRFDYGRTNCELIQSKAGLRRRSRYTEFRMDWKDNNILLNLSTAQKSVFDGVHPAKAVTISDNPQFQSMFNIYSNDPIGSENLLSSNVQWKLQQLNSHCDGLTFSIRNGLIRVRCNSWFKKPEELEDFIQHSLELFDQMMLVDAKGLEFLHADQASVIQNVKCPICSDEIMQEMVVCQRCKTPHCLDCWDYNGKCATFACNETRYHRTNPQVATS